MPTPISQLLSRTVYATDGATTVWDFSFSGGYLAQGHVKAYTETTAGARTPITVTPGMLIGQFQLEITPALADGDTLVIYRDTPKDLPLVDFTDESGFSEIALDTNAKQAVFIAAEAADEIALFDVTQAVDAVEQASAFAASASASASLAGAYAGAAEVSAEESAIAASAAAVSAASAAGAAEAAVDTFRADLAAPGGAGLVGYSVSTTYPIKTTGRKLKERISIADKLTTDSPTSAQVVTALQAAIDTGAKRIYISDDYTINAGVALGANQIIDFDGGSLVVDVGTVAANGILYGNAKANIKIIDPIIDCSATSGLRGINLIDCPNGRVVDGYLTKANLSFQAASNAARMGYKARGTIIDCDGFAAPGVYISAANKVGLYDLELFNGLEGVGIYNDARNIKHSGIDSHNHTQDGFVVIAGQHIDYTGCFSYDNGQSGFTTQRQTGADNTKRITYNGCHAYGNAYDGFDLRGANAAAWGSDMLVTATGCISTGNTGTGFFVVFAEGTQLIGCQAYSNLQQNFFIHTSNRVQLTVCRSGSGASAVSSGNSKTGILIFDSGAVTVNGCQSSNSDGATQDYGISFTGSSAYGQVIGGYYDNNTTGPYDLGTNNRLVGAQAETASGIGVFLRSVSYLGIYDEDGVGVPSHTRPKGSAFTRIDGGGGELYISNGGGSWTAH